MRCGHPGAQALHQRIDLQVQILQRAAVVDVVIHLQGGVLLIASLVMAINLGVDLLYGFLNPRIRHKR